MNWKRLSQNSAYGQQFCDDADTGKSGDDLTSVLTYRLFLTTLWRFKARPKDGLPLTAHDHSLPPEPKYPKQQPLKQNLPSGA